MPVLRSRSGISTTHRRDGGNRSRWIWHCGRKRRIVCGEELAAETLFELFPVGLPIVMHILSLLFCFIQAMVFTMLLAVFIHEATEDEE